jgi:hypothetical protein
MANYGWHSPELVLDREEMSAKLMASRSKRGERD